MCSAECLGIQIITIGYFNSFPFRNPLYCSTSIFGPGNGPQTLLILLLLLLLS